jgi:outer membrane scaffolding protein for murein synthesis (MipA/OmpV family)
MTSSLGFRFFIARSIVGSLVPLTALAAGLHPLWELGAGAAMLTLPDYRGSDEQRGYVFPIPYFVYHGEVLQVDREKVRGLFFKTPRLELDVSVSGSVPVKSDKNRARAGMPDLDPTIELGPQMNIMLGQKGRTKLTLQLPLRAVIAVGSHGLRNAGLLSNPILNLDIKDFGWGAGWASGWNLGLSGGPLWADSKYHQHFYGVDPAFATPQRPAYDAPGGYSGTQFTVSLSKRFHRTWVGAFVRAYDLHGVAFEDSPLLKKNTAFMAGFGVSYIFAQSSKRVLSED